MKLFICYPKCSTCAKARDYLNSNNIDFEERDIKLNRPTKKELNDWVNKSGIAINKFFNTSGLVYRSNNIKDKLKTLSFDEKLELLASDGMLVKRPILVDGNQVLVGYKIDEWKTKINK